MNRTPVSIKATADLEVTVQITLSENAAQALHTIALFDRSAFMKAAAASYGSELGADEQAGMEELFKVALEQVRPIMERAQAARAVFAGKKVAGPLPRPQVAPL